VAIAPGDGCSLQVCNFILYHIDIDVVIAATMHLGKSDFLYHIAT
jgi:hypothetical protein